MWSRRQFLGALGASGAASALSPLLGCGAQTTAPTSASIPLVGDEDFASALAILDAKRTGATLFSRKANAYELSLDHDEERFNSSRIHLVILTIVVDQVPTRIVLKNPTRDDLRVAAVSLAETAIAPPVNLAAVSSVGWQDTWTKKHSDYRARIRSLFSRSQDHGGSRVVYRSSYLYSVHTENRFLSDSQNIRSRARRTRGGVVMGAWAGGSIATAHAQVSGQGGPALVALSDDAIAGVADRTLAHLHARSAPSGIQDVLLSPEVSARVAYNAIAKSQMALSGDYKIRIEDDPTSGYGAMSHTDGGQSVAPHTLVGENASALPLSARLRHDSDGAPQSQPSHVRVESGPNNLAALVGRVEAGVLLEGPELCRLGSNGERLAIVCSRGREILKGRFTGRLFARMLATASLSEFIASTTAIGRDREVHAFETGGIAGSAEAPHWLSRARVHKA